MSTVMPSAEFVKLPPEKLMARRVGKRRMKQATRSRRRGGSGGNSNDAPGGNSKEAGDLAASSTAASVATEPSDDTMMVDATEEAEATGGGGEGERKASFTDKLVPVGTGTVYAEKATSGRKKRETVADRRQRTEADPPRRRANAHTKPLAPRGVPVREDRALHFRQPAHRGMSHWAKSRRSVFQPPVSSASM